jgi:hypothetical protein
MGKISQYPSNVNGNEEIIKHGEGILKTIDERKGEVIPIEDGVPHFGAEMICVFCGKRGLDIFPRTVRFKDLECGSCGKSGGMVCTGQPIEGDE